MNHIQKKIKTILNSDFCPEKLEIMDEGFRHEGHRHAGEGHYALRIVSRNFENRKLIDRHRAVYNSLKKLLGNGVHALKIEAHTPEEWKKKQITK